MLDSNGNLVNWDMVTILRKYHFNLTDSSLHDQYFIVSFFQEVSHT